jgi:hypothetical protein
MEENGNNPEETKISRNLLKYGNKNFRKNRV